jgi:uncharacterized protein YdaU (DUF1376 family)
MTKKIKYVQLEPAEVLLDFHKSRMTAEQFGCYWLIILNLYCEGGKINFDLKELSHFCSCSENFEKAWEKIKSKFQIKKNKITHKRVTSELRRARKFIQHQRTAGLASAKARQPRFNRGAETVEPSNVNEKEVKESKDNRNEVKKNEVCSGPADTVFSSALSSITARSDPAPGSLLSQQLRFYDKLKEIIRPANESDLTCFHRLSQWLVKEITFKRFNEHIFGRVLDMARESSTGSRNPAAVFMSRLKKELNYKP